MSERRKPEHVAHLLPAHAVGTLDGAERADVLAHLPGCPACRAELAAWQAIGQTAKEIYLDSAPDDGPALQQALRRIDALTERKQTPPVSLDGRTTRGLEPGSRTMGSRLLRPPIPASRGRWAVAQFATVLLMLVTVGLGYFTVGPGRPSADRAVYFPAIQAPAISTPGVLSETTLLQVALPADLVPHGDELRNEIGHATILPGDRTEWTPGEDAGSSGIRAYYMLKGTLSLRAAADVHLVRSGATELDTVPAGWDVALAAGDTWIAPSSAAFAAVSGATGPTEVLYWVLTTDVFDYPLPGSWTDTDFESVEGLTGPSGAATLRLRQVELAVKGRLPAPPGELQFGTTLPYNAAGTPVSMVSAAVGRLPADGTLVNAGKKAVTAYVLTLEPAASSTPDVLSEETLLQLSLPAEAVPQGDDLMSEIGLASVRPGARTEWTPGEDVASSGIRVGYVLKGTLSLRAGTDVQLVRAGSMVRESVAADTDVLLAAGDSWIAPSATAFAATSDSVRSTEVVYFVLTSAPKYDLPGSWTFLDYEWVPELTVPPGAKMLRLRRVELAVNGRRPAPPDGLQFGTTAPVNVAGTPVSVVSAAVGRLPADGTLVNVGKQVITVYAITLDPSEPGEGTPRP
ncbi:MAG: zf-HC2 domain-containing protein [Chloroflexia bacterium]|nr:zf-HC2 domain-containing protein [Chloroflexia bacterium]